MNVLTVNTLVVDFFLLRNTNRTLLSYWQCCSMFRRSVCAKLRIFSIFMTAVFVRQQIFSRKLRYKYMIYEGKKLKTHSQIVTIYIQHHIKPQIIYTVNIFTWNLKITYLFMYHFRFTSFSTTFQVYILAPALEIEENTQQMQYLHICILKFEMWFRSD